MTRLGVARQIIDAIVYVSNAYYVVDTKNRFIVASASNYISYDRTSASCHIIISSPQRGLLMQRYNTNL